MLPVGCQPGAWRLDSALHPSAHLPLFWEPRCSPANPAEPQTADHRAQTACMASYGMLAFGLKPDDLWQPSKVVAELLCWGTPRRRFFFKGQEATINQNESRKRIKWEDA